MAIHQWPQQERPRERLVSKGSEALSDAELLAILLGHGTRGKSALSVARELIQQFHGLHGIFAASFADLKKLPGLGLAKYCQLHASLELSRRYLQESLQRDRVITQAKDAEDFLLASLRNCEREVFAALFLDNRHRVIEFERLSYGTIHSANIYPRELVKRALHHNAAAVIVAHNHPSGAVEPSTADQEVTQILKQALALVEVRLIDHIIVGDTKTLSLAEHGLFHASSRP